MSLCVSVSVGVYVLVLSVVLVSVSVGVYVLVMSVVVYVPLLVCMS